MKMIDNLIKRYEEEVNAIIDTNYNYFYIQPYRASVPGKYGVIFNGQQIALCESLRELESVKSTILFLLSGGLKNE